MNVEQLRQLEQAATPGPWEHGDVWRLAGVLYDDGTCVLCERMGAPVWKGMADINGERMMAHKHRDPEPWGIGHLLSAPDGLVAGNYDYETGGVINPDDATLIAAARNALPALLDIAEAAEAVETGDVEALLRIGGPVEHRGDTHRTPDDFELTGDYQEDARYILPARDKLIDQALRAALSRLDTEGP